MSTDSRMLSHCYCRDCGFDIVEICCNNENFIDEEPYNQFEWWLYCSNKTCKNHGGEGMTHNFPDWVSEYDNNIYDTSSDLRGYLYTKRDMKYVSDEWEEEYYEQNDYDRM